MADTKVSALAQLTDLANDDELIVVDKSDTSMAASGTNKRVTVQSVFDALARWRLELTPFAALSDSSGASAPAAAGYYYGGRRQISGSGCYMAWDEVLAAGTWTVTLIHNAAPSYGIIKIQIDGTTVASVDAYNAGFVDHLLPEATGISVAASGKKRLRVFSDTKNASSSGYGANIMALVWQRTA